MTILPKTKTNSGQTLLVVVLIISVSLIVVMSVIARSITDVKISDKEDESLRAFSAAEAGVEESLAAGTAVVDNTIGFNSTYTSLAGGTTTTFISPTSLLSGETLTVWFINHNADGSLKLDCTDGTCYTWTSVNVYWGDTTPTSNDQIPALEMTFYYTPAANLGDLSNIKLTRVAYDANAAGRRSINNFTAPTDYTATSFLGTTFLYHSAVTIPVIASYKSIFVKIQALYNTSIPVKFGFRSLHAAAGGYFPSQGVIVNSSGNAGEANRKISVFQGYADDPGVFDAGIYSAGDIQKQ